jgi:chorismate mutase/prephenate dehydratase
MIRVAIQGETGSYSEEAARMLFGDTLAIIGFEDFESAFLAVRHGGADHAVIPIENKIVGDIVAPRELMRSGGYRVYDRVVIEVRHVLAGTGDATLERIESIRSHVEALKQCRLFLDSLGDVRKIICADTASAAREIVAEGDPVNAAICSRRAADIYGARIICENIADDPDNRTTFVVIGN